MTSQRLTVPQFVARKRAGQKIAVVTAYDYPFGKIADESGVEAILVGDSLAMVVQGHETTLPVTLDQMIYHGEMVCRAARRALVIVDLPFPCYHLGEHKAVEYAGRVMKETHCQAVKLEGGVQQGQVIAALVSAGIPVMAHVGLRPQSVHQLGGYKVQRDAEQLLADARAAEDSGAFAVVLECIPSSVAGDITRALTIPTIGIGAGPQCDGQVLVLHDVLGVASGYVPRFVRSYAKFQEQALQALRQFADDVRSGAFPNERESYS